MGVFEGVFPQWAYLIGYNSISALLWFAIFVTTALTGLTNGLGEVYPAARTLVLFTQTLAVLEIIHAVTGKYFTYSIPNFPTLGNAG